MRNSVRQKQVNILKEKDLTQLFMIKSPISAQNPKTQSNDTKLRQQKLQLHNDYGPTKDGQ